MNALVKTQEGKGFLELKEVEKPYIKNNEVLVEIKAAGICGTDIHIRDGGFFCIPPVIIGHEFSGRIVETGKDVKKLKTGDRIVAEPHRGGCGVCRNCQTGHVEICTEKKALGYKVDGCFTSLVSLPETSVHKIPDSVSYDEAALSEPLAVTVKAVLERSKVEPEDFVVVLGCGTLGLLAAAVAKAEGAREVMITGTNMDEKTRFKAAEELGIDYIVNVQKDDALKIIAEKTGGMGADLVIDASGAEIAINQAFEMIRRDGRICAIGITGKEKISIPYDEGIMKSATLSWSLSSTWTSWERAVSLMASGKINVKPLISKSYPLEKWEDAFQLVDSLEAIKVLLIP